MASESRLTKRIASIPIKTLEEQLKVIVDGLDPVNVGCCVILIAELGLRVDEVCGLSWADIDFGAKTISIRRSCGYDGVLRELRAEDCRTVPMTPVAYESLEALRKYCELIKRLYKRDFLGDDTAVMHDAFGKRMPPRTISTWWCYNRERLSVDDWSLADVWSARRAIDGCKAEIGSDGRKA